MNSTIVIYLYWIFFCFILLLYKRIRDYSFSILLLIFSFLILLLTYHGLHSDWVAYRLYYELAVGIGQTYFEKGFDLLLFFSNKISSFEIVPIFTCFSFLLLFLILYKERIYGTNSFFVLLFSFYCSFLPLYFGALRQGIAANFLYISLVLLYKKKYWRSICFFCLALLFHNFSILILSIYVVFNFYCFITKRMKYKQFIVITFIISFGMYIVFKANIEKLFVALGMAYRLGNADNFTSNPIKDLFILAERVVFVYFCFVLFPRENAFSRFLLRVYLGGNFFYCIFYSLARNLAGRTLAFYRYLDIYVMYEAFRVIIPRLFYKQNTNISFEKNASLNNVSLLFCIFYSLIKYYVTVATSGVF